MKESTLPCVECGKKHPIYKKGICIDCYLKNHAFSSGPDYLDLTICNTCHSFKYKNTWTQKSFRQILNRIIQDTFTISKELTETTISSDCALQKNNTSCTITIAGKINDHIEIEKHPITIRVHNTICTTCSRKHGGYYEAILQIRKDKEKMSNKERAYYQQRVEEYISQQQKTGNSALFLTDIGVEKTGIDFYLSDASAAQSLVKKLYSQHGGELKQSSKNVGMKDGRQIYRMTYLLRLPPFAVGDIIHIQHTYFLITSFYSGRIHAQNLSTWEDRMIQTKDIKKSDLVRNYTCIKDAILVSESTSELQIMDPTTYKTVDIPKPKKLKELQKNVSLIKIDESYYLLPF